MTLWEILEIIIDRCWPIFVIFVIGVFVIWATF